MQIELSAKDTQSTKILLEKASVWAAKNIDQGVSINSNTNQNLENLSKYLNANILDVDQFGSVIKLINEKIVSG